MTNEDIPKTNTNKSFSTDFLGLESPEWSRFINFYFLIYLNSILNDNSVQKIRIIFKPNADWDRFSTYAHF